MYSNELNDLYISLFSTLEAIRQIIINYKFKLPSDVIKFKSLCVGVIYDVRHELYKADNVNMWHNSTDEIFNKFYNLGVYSQILLNVLNDEI